MRSWTTVVALAALQLTQLTIAAPIMATAGDDVSALRRAATAALTNEDWSQLVALATRLDQLSHPSPPPAPLPRPPSTDSAQVSLKLRNGTSEVTKTFNTSEMAFVIIDMWDYHYCKTATNRAGILVARLNRALRVARKLGIMVVHSPTEVSEDYVGTPQRERAVVPPSLRVPMPVNASRSLPGASKPGGDLPDIPASCVAAGAVCECGGTAGWCQFNEGEGRMHASLEIGPEDYIVGGINGAPTNGGRGGGTSEIYSLLKSRGIKTLIYLGIAENVCILNKAEGMKQMYELGFDVHLARDVTDAFTAFSVPRSYPEEPMCVPENGTRTVTAWMEQVFAPTTYIGDLLKDHGEWAGLSDEETIAWAPWGQNDRPHVYDLSSEEPLIITAHTPCAMQYDVGGCEKEWPGDTIELRYMIVNGTGGGGGRSFPPLHCNPKAAPAEVCPGGVRCPADGVCQLDTRSNFTLTIDNTVLCVPDRWGACAIRVYQALGQTTTVLGAGFRKSSGERVFAVSSTVLVKRPMPVEALPRPWLSLSSPNISNAVVWLTNSYYRRTPTMNNSYHGGGAGGMEIGNLHMADGYFSDGIGLWAPSHINYNLSAEPLKTLLASKNGAAFVAKVGMDTAWCFDWAPVPQTAGKFWDCHDTAQFGSAVVKIYVDGRLVSESPVLRVVEAVWPIYVPLPANATFLRIVAMRGPTRGDEDGLAGVAESSEALWGTLGPAVRKGPQNAYDFVDVVHAGFVARIPYTLVPSHSCAAGLSNFTCDKNHSLHGQPSDNCAAQAAAACDKTPGCDGFSIAPCPGDAGLPQVLCDKGVTGDVAVLCKAGSGAAVKVDQSSNFWRSGSES